LNGEKAPGPNGFSPEVLGGFERGHFYSS